MASDPYQNPVVPGLRLADWVIEEAFDRVMIDVKCHNKQDIRAEYVDAQRTGTFKDMQNVIIKSLKDYDWTWGAFDIWNNHFNNIGAWPYMWKRLEGLIQESASTSSSNESVFMCMSFKEMRYLAKTYTPEVKLPRSKNDMAALLIPMIPNLALDSICYEIRCRLTRDHDALKRQSKCELLDHTILHTAFSIREWHQFIHLDGSIQAKRIAVILPSDCKIENEYAAKFNNGEIKDHPPFFPGDRNHIDRLLKL